MSSCLFDLGNTRLKWASLGASGIGASHAVTHDGTRFAEGWEATLPADLHVAHVASVASPALTAALLDALSRRARLICRARTQRRFGAVRIAYAQPERLGVDRFLALLAAHARGVGPALLVGVGTALTVDLLDGEGMHLGGRIAPSPALMRAALHARAPQLPGSGGAFVEFADDTDAALASGCIGAALGLVACSREAARKRLGIPVRLLLHGGGGAELQPFLPDAEAAPQLVLEGLAQWARG